MTFATHFYNIKTVALASLCCILLSTSLMAQHPGAKPLPKERLKELRVAYFTQKLDLRVEEAQLFWPVFNAYTEELDQLHEARMHRNREMKGKFEQVKDAELEKAINEHFATQQKELDIRKKYLPQFKKVLPLRKVARLYVAEREFPRYLLRMARRHRQDDESAEPPRRRRWR